MGDNTKVIEFMRDEFSEDILKEIEEEGISKTEVLQLLRDMEMMKENGEMGWDSEDEPRQQGQDISMKNVLEVLSMEIMTSHEGLFGMSQQEGGARYDIPNGPDQSGGKAEGEKSEEAVKKKNKWGPIRGERRSTRLANDSRPAMEKTKENKKKGDLEDNYNKGKTRNSSRSNSSKHVFNIIDAVGIKLGPDENKIAENLEACLELNKSLNKAEVSRTVGSVDWGADIDYVRKVGENEKARGVCGQEKCEPGDKGKRGKHPRKKGGK
jgi:hypothetical protein